jgi:hypothetical protein
MERLAEKADFEAKRLQFMELIDEGFDFTPKGRQFLKGIDDLDPKREVFDMAKQAWDDLAAKYGFTSKYEMDPNTGGRLIPKGERVTTDPTGTPITVYEKGGADAKTGIEASIDKILMDVRNTKTASNLDTFFKFDENGNIVGMKKVKGYGTVSMDSLDELGVKTRGDLEKAMKDGGVLVKPTTTAAKILDDIITSKDVKYDKTLQEFAKRLRAVMRQDIDTTITGNPGFIPKGIAGFYNRIGHRIVIKNTADKWVHLHEIAHALTVNKLDFGDCNQELIIRKYENLNTTEMINIL